MLTVAVVSAVVYRRATAPRVPRIDVQSMKMTRLTDYGNVGTAAISRDGRHLAYTVGYQQPSLWVQQVGSDSKLQVVPPSSGEIIAVTFSPDGNNLYYVRDRKGYVVPALGGRQGRLLRKPSVESVSLPMAGSWPSFTTAMP